MASFIAQGEVAHGVQKMEEAVTATRFMKEIRERGFKITETWKMYGPDKDKS